MKNIEFNKKCVAGDLHKLLVAGGFDIYGVSTAGDLTIVHLKDSETKDPSTVVNSYTYVKPLPEKSDIDKVIERAKLEGWL